MPRTIEQGLADFRSNIRASTAEVSATFLHRASIEDCLKRKFGLKRRRLGIGTQFAKWLLTTN